MRKPTLLILALAPALSGQFAADETTRLSYPFPAFSRAGERKIQARDVYLDTFGKKGQPIKRHLFAIFDPTTHYFLFGYNGLGDVEKLIEANRRGIPSDVDRTRASAAAYVSERGIVLVEPGRPSLGIITSDQKAASLDDAERQAISALKANALDAARNIDWPPTKYVPLMMRDGTRVDPGCLPPCSAFCEPPSLLGVAESNNGWEVTIKSEWSVRITLSPSFEVLKEERVGPAAP